MASEGKSNTFSPNTGPESQEEQRLTAVYVQKALSAFPETAPLAMAANEVDSALADAENNPAQEPETPSTFEEHMTREMARRNDPELEGQWMLVLRASLNAARLRLSMTEARLPEEVIRETVDQGLWDDLEPLLKTLYPETEEEGEEDLLEDPMQILMEVDNEIWAEEEERLLNERMSAWNEWETVESGEDNRPERPA